MIAIGREIAGADTIVEKAPHLAAIDVQSLAKAEAFGAAFIFSETVSYHAMPDELEFYFAALKQLANMPGSVLFFSARLVDAEHEYIQGCWARPLHAHTQPLAPLNPREYALRAGGCRHAGITRATLEFRRA